MFSLWPLKYFLEKIFTDLKVNKANIRGMALFILICYLSVCSSWLRQRLWVCVGSLTLWAYLLLLRTSTKRWEMCKGINNLLFRCERFPVRFSIENRYLSVKFFIHPANEQTLLNHLTSESQHMLSLLLFFWKSGDAGVFCMATSNTGGLTIVAGQAPASGHTLHASREVVSSLSHTHRGNMHVQLGGGGQLN